MLVFSSDLRLYGETIDAAAHRLRELRADAFHPSHIDSGASS
jgi:hypothetical protein